MDAIVRTKKEMRGPSKYFAERYETCELLMAPAPPFKGKEWVEKLLEVFEEMHGDWEEAQECPVDDNYDDEGGQAWRLGERHLNPAEDLTASGTVERPWSEHRLAAYARSKGFANVTWRNVDSWVDDQPQETLPTHYEAKGWSANRSWDEASGQYNSLKVHGTDYWGENFTLNTEMDANTDPWFSFNQDTNTSLDVFQGEWVQSSLEKRVAEQLKLFEESCERDAAKHDARRRQIFTSNETIEQQVMDDYFTVPASMTFEDRLRTANYASNKWIDNVDMMPDKEWNPTTPKIQWSARTQCGPSLNQFIDQGDDEGDGYGFMSGEDASRRAALGTLGRGLLAGLGLLAGGGGAGEARAEDAMSVSSDEFGYFFYVPDGWKSVKKPVRTHQDEVLVKSDKNRGSEVGLAVDPVKIDSITQFGTPKEVAAKVLAVERKKDGVTGARLVAVSSEEKEGGTYYTIEYESKSSRGDKHFISQVTIVNKKLYALTAQSKIDKFEEDGERLRAAVNSFKVVTKK